MEDAPKPKPAKHLHHLIIITKRKETHRSYKLNDAWNPARAIEDAPKPKPAKHCNT